MSKTKEQALAEYQRCKEYIQSIGWYFKSTYEKHYMSNFDKFGGYRLVAYSRAPDNLDNDTLWHHVWIDFSLHAIQMSYVGDYPDEINSDGPTTFVKLEDTEEFFTFLKLFIKGLSV